MPEQRLYAFLEQHNIPQQTIEHAAAFTVAEIPPEVFALPGAHVKSLLLVDKAKNFWLVIALDETRVDLKWLAAETGAQKFSFAKAEDLLALLQVTPGSVTPFALLCDPDHKVKVIVEKDIFNHTHINGHPMRNTATTTVAMDDFKRFLTLCGHPYQTRSLVPEENHVAA